MLKLNRIYQGDCLTLMQDISDNSVDCIIIDPPYSTPVLTGFGRKKVLNVADLSIQEGFFNEIRRAFGRILKSSGRVFIFCDDRFYPILFAVFYSWKNKNLLIWNKGRIGMGNPFRKQHELIFYVNRESFNYRRSENIKYYSTVLDYSAEKNRVHPAQKPIRLLEDLILGFTDEKGLVLDCFVGSGTTAVACKNLNRNFIGIDLSAEYCELARARLQNE